MLSWRPTRGLARKSLTGIPRRAGTSETGTEEWLPPEPLELLPWEPGGEPWKPSCDMPAGTLDTDPWGSSGSPEWGSWSQYQKDSGGDRKWVISGHLGGWPMGGCFSATEYGHLIPWGYLERDFRVFEARVCPSDSASRNWVVPRNFIAGSGSNGCNNFPQLDRLPLHPPWLLL